ncbi:uncharacterized protein METZ01_LOCUS125984 [marine metagenome]|jgi:hypothetical protein|uniref:Uncharacterized protein n=1 Tax=marine metagenome TaxID=408172 RepID=A0A381Y8A4_9ZZZZ
MDKKGYNNLNLPYRGGTSSMVKNHQGQPKPLGKINPIFS